MLFFKIKLKRLPYKNNLSFFWMGKFFVSQWLLFLTKSSMAKVSLYRLPPVLLDWIFTALLVWNIQQFYLLCWIQTSETEGLLSAILHFMKKRVLYNRYLSAPFKLRKIFCCMIWESNSKFSLITLLRQFLSNLCPVHYFKQWVLIQLGKFWSCVHQFS